MADSSLDQLLETATLRHRAGDLAEARRLYRQVLAEVPSHTVALFRGGLLELQDGHAEAALALIELATANAPGEPRHHFGLGRALQALGRYEEAATAYRSGLAADPHSADGHFALAITLQLLGNPALLPQAEAAYRQVLALQAGNADAMSNLGILLQEMGRIDEAVEILRAAVALQPNVALHGVNLGIALCRRHDFGAAEDILRRTCVHDRSNPEAAFNLGIALHGLGRLREAADQFRHAAALRPGYADALNNLGNVCTALGDFTAAETAYIEAIRARPDYLVAINNLGCLLRTRGRFEEAEETFRRGMQLNPGHAVLYDNLGSVLKDTGELDAAVDCFRKALELDPGNAATHSNLAYALSFQSLNGRSILAECLRWNDRFAAMLPATSSYPNDRSPDRRLRIGYVSPDFREHCQALFTVPLLSKHDHRAFEIFCYASVERPDELTRRIAGCADVWREVRPLNDEALADRIRGDRIDILVDLTMHMANGRPLLFARKPAPLQVAWLAYPGTTGIGAMDYRLTDWRLDPAGSEDQYSERSMRLPDAFWCYDPLAAGPSVNALPAIERGHVTFGCLNNPCKLTEQTLRLWARVMQAVPGSRLELLAPPGRHRQRLLERLAVHGMAERVGFVPYRARAEYLLSYHGIDIGLDTFPYNGHTTSLDSLWMGVPTVTRVGETCVGRGGLSQLFQIGLTELAAETDAAFTAAAVALANDLPRLGELRQGLRARLERSALMDAGRFARNLEAAYRTMWQTYCRAPAAGDTTITH
jgi:protein O-GlcNAc transferase